MRPALAIAVALSSALAAMAGEPCSSCSSCSSSVPRCAAAKPKTCHGLHPAKRYYGPVISPSTPYGYFQTNWRPWNAGIVHVEQSTPVIPAPSPSPMPKAKPETPGQGNTAAMPIAGTYAKLARHN